MKVQYVFSIETFFELPDKKTVKTALAEIELIPDGQNHNLLTKAIVRYDGPHSVERMFQARYDLIKVILRHASVDAIVVNNLSVPDSFDQIPTDGEPASLARHGITKIGSMSLMDPWEYRLQVRKNLKIDVNSNSPAIFCYYEAMRKDDSIDKFVQLFKVIEFFSGITKKGKKLKVFMDHLDKTWWIPDDAMEIARGLLRKQSLSKSELALNLYGLRGKCSHLEPEYGLSPIDFAGISEISAMIVVLEMVARHSLERNPTTRENA
jgi:hypothetical protein